MKKISALLLLPLLLIGCSKDQPFRGETLPFFDRAHAAHVNFITDKAAP